MNFIKKIKVFNTYRKCINENKKTITGFQHQFHNDKRLQPRLRIDHIYRIYTVLNLPEEEIKAYMDGKMVEKYISSYIRSVDVMFKKIGLQEMIGMLDLKQLDETHYLIIFGFSFFNTRRMANISLISFILFIFGISIYFLNF